MPLNVEKYSIGTQTNGIPLVSPMKRYTDAAREEDRQGPGVILLLGHGAGFFKETWEPTIEELYKRDKKHIIREVWGLDCQNHGEGCTLNEDILVRKPDVLTIWDYADAFASLVKSGFLGNIDPKLHKVVLCGHSAGSVAVTLSTSYFNPPYIVPQHISSLILVDPPIWSREKEGQLSDVYKMVEAMTPIRKDVWKTFDEAQRWLGKRFPWAGWDARVLEKYVKYGIRSLPSAFYPDTHSGVTLTTHRVCENIAFTGQRFSYDALNRLNQICEYIPVHLVYGARNDMFERDVQDSLLNEREKRTFASIQRLEDVGHLVVQEAPTQLAEAIYAILTKNDGPTKPQSKL